jgi:protein-disulfide isomerase
MSRKTKRNLPDPGQSSQAPGASTASETRRWMLIIGSIVTLLLVAAVAMIVAENRAEQAPRAASGASASGAALASEHAPQLGDPAARVHVVEFLDPACETCAMFYPIVKQLLADNPGRVRISLRHVALHEGSDYVVALLEASREQDKYWETLEALFASQSQWAVNHTVHPELALQAVTGVGLDLDRLVADMSAADVVQRVQRDRADAMALKVTATPEYFVNGRPLPSFGQQQLLDLVAEELQRAY